MSKIIYIHGFNSSPQSEKAQLTKAWFDQNSNHFDIEIASFPVEPKHAIAALEEQIIEYGKDQIAGFIGSSLGGYYSLYLHARFPKPAALINPALKPYILLKDYLGTQTNLYTGEEYVVTDLHMNQLEDIDSVAQANPQELYLLTQSADETLDFREAVNLLPTCTSWIQFGGSHSFEQFSNVLPSISAFFRQKCSK